MPLLRPGTTTLTAPDFGQGQRVYTLGLEESRAPLRGPMTTYLQLVSKTPVLLTTLALTLILVAAFWALPICGETLDGTWGYTHKDAVAALEGYGPEGRRVYAWSSATLDTLFPLAYVSLLAGLLYRFPLTPRLSSLAYLPVGVGAIDLCENIQIILLILLYPNVFAVQVASASLFTMSKLVAFSLCLTLAVTFNLDYSRRW